MSDLFSRMPSYYVAADNHAIANADGSSNFEQGVVGAVAGFAAGAAIGGPAAIITAPLGAYLGYNTAATDGKFLAATTINAANSLTNSAISIYNLLPGTNEDHVKIEDWMKAYDDDLFKYYEDNKDFIDVNGFIAASIVPGTAGIKVYNKAFAAMNAAKYGKLGINMSEATGIFGGKSQMYLAKASTELAKLDSGGRFLTKALNANTIKGIIAGAGEQVMQNAVFEAAALAATFESPMLDNMDATDIFWNSMGGLAFGAGIGSLINTSAAFGTIKSTMRGYEKQLRPYEFIDQPVAGSEDWHKLMVNTVNEYSTPNSFDGIPADLVDRAKSLRAGKITTLHNDNRLVFQNMAEGDKYAANLGYDIIMNSRSGLADTAEMVHGLKHVSNINVESSAKKAEAKIRAKLDSGKQVKPEEYNALNIKSSYIQVFGDQQFTTVSHVPAVKNIQDTLKPGQQIEIKGNKVVAGDKTYKMSIKDNKPFDPVELFKQEGNHYAHQARELWAMKGGWSLPKDHVIDFADASLIRKAIREYDSLDNVGIRYPGMKDPVFPASLDEWKDILETSVTETTNKLKKLSENNEVISDIWSVADKLRVATGMNFKLISKSEPGIPANARAFARSVGEGTTREVYLVAENNVGRTLDQVITTLKHEQGHIQWEALVAATGRDLSTDTTLIAEMTKVSKLRRPEMWDIAKIHAETLDYLSNPHELAADTFALLSTMSKEEAKALAPTFNAIAETFIMPLDSKVIDQLFKKYEKLSTNEIAAITGVRIKGAAGEADSVINDRFLDLSAFDYYENSFRESFKTIKDKDGVQTKINPDDILLGPQHLRLDYDASKLVSDPLKPFIDESIAILAKDQIILQEGIDRAIAPVLGAKFEQLPEFVKSAIIEASAHGDTHGLMKFTNGDYFSVGSTTARIGKVVHDTKVEATNRIRDNFSPLLIKLDKDQDATLELSSLIRITRETPDTYVLDIAEDGSPILILEGLKKYRDAIADGNVKAKPYTKIKEDAADIIPIKSELVSDILNEHVNFNRLRVTNQNNIRGAQRLPSNKNPNAVYFAPENAKDYPYFAFVVEKDSITKTNHKKMIYAATEDELAQLINKVPKDRYNVLTKSDTENWKKAVGEYQDQLALHDNYMSADLYRSGVSANFFPPTNAEKIIRDLERWHIRSEHNLIEEAVSAHYFKEFAELNKLGERLTALQTAQFNRRSLFKGKTSDIENPFNAYVNEALDRPKYSEIPFYAAQYGIDKAVTRVWNVALDMLSKSNSPNDLDKINTHFQEAGINTGYYDASMELLANQSIDRGALSTFVRRANSIISALAIRTDVFNGINNAIGLSVLHGAETHAILNAIKGKPGAVKEWNALGKVLIPGTDDWILSPEKLISKAITDSFNPVNRQWAFDRGFSMRHVAELSSIHDDLAWSSLYTANDINGKLTSAYNKAMKFVDKAELVTGNKYAEEFTRLVSALTMKNITDIAIKHGVIGEKAADAAIGTFVNRVAGNYQASQRPLMFQGPIGQAVGLFQTYQVNLIQQLFRHIADGQKKSAAVMMALQGSVYGMNGLPAFQAFNTQLVGGAAGNSDNNDIYKMMYTQQDRNLADFMMYGMSANLFGLIHPDLKTNIYNRGDINPRHITIIPTSFADLPIVNATTKLFGSLKTAISTAASGDPWNAFIRGMEHNGLSRPLTGISQLLGALASDDMKVVATSARGDLRAANDLLSLTSAVRIFGAKPLDEAVTADMAYRSQVYNAMRRDKIEALGQSIKSKLVRGQELDDDDVINFMSSYVKSGGRQEQFNQWMMRQMMLANTAQANRLADDLKKPEAQVIQNMMGGGRMMDYSDR